MSRPNNNRFLPAILPQVTFYARSGGIEDANSAGGSQVTNVARSGGIDGILSYSGTQTSQVARSGGIESNLDFSGNVVDRYILNVNDTVTIVDGVLDTDTLTPADQVGVTDQVQVIVTIYPADTVSISDQLVAETDNLNIAESVSINDSYSTHLVLNISDVVFVNDGLPSDIVSHYDDSVSVTDQIEFILTVPVTRVIDLDGSPFNGVGSITRIKWTRPTSKPERKLKTRRQLQVDAAARIVKRKELPKTYPAGAHKALNEFKDFYGEEEGTRIFLQKAVERGKGQTLAEQISSTYKTGADLPDKPLRSSEFIKTAVKETKIVSSPTRIVSRSLTKTLSKNGK
jgi:hypothetical protein